MNKKREKLTKNSKIYQDTIRTKAINNMDYSSSIVKILDCRHEYVYDCEIKHPVWGNVNKSKTGLSQDKMREIEEMSPVDKAAELGKIDNCADDDEWRAFGDFSIRIEIKLLIKLPDSEEKELFVSEKLDSYKDIKRMSNLYNIVNSSVEIDVTVKENNKYILNTGEFLFNAFPRLDDNSDNFSIKISNYRETKKVIIFLSNNKRWTEARLEDPLIENKNEIIIPVSFTSIDGKEDSKIMFHLNNPETNNKMWDLIEKLGVGDPRMISGEKVYITHQMIENKGLIDNKTWFMSPEKPKTEGLISSTINYMKKLTKM